MFFYDLYVGLHVRIPMSNWFTYLGIVSSNFLSKKLKKLKDETLVVLYHMVSVSTFGGSHHGSGHNIQFCGLLNPFFVESLSGEK